MNKQRNITKKLFEVLKMLSIINNLNLYDDTKFKIMADKKPLIQVNAQGMIMPLLSDYLFSNKNPLADNFVEMSLLQTFVIKMSNENSVIRLNHIGFCYKVNSQNKERVKIKNEIAKTNWNLYEMESNDAGLWLFIGNNVNWQDPMIELLPVEKTNDKWVNYWLPHIHIDLDTTLSNQEIEKSINDMFKGKITPFRSCVINGIVYGIRARLGIVSGVNINLDFASKERDVRYSREQLLKLIV
jgi:hypothetical protein